MKAKVWNMNDKDYTEEFEGEVITIPAKGFVTMERSKAIKFKGSYCPVIVDGKGHDVQPKKIVVEVDAEQFAEKTKQPFRFRSEITKDQYRTEEGMKKAEELYLAAEAKREVEKPAPRKKANSK